MNEPLPNRRKSYGVIEWSKACGSLLIALKPVWGNELMEIVCLVADMEEIACEHCILCTILIITCINSTVSFRYTGVMDVAIMAWYQEYVTRAYVLGDQYPVHVGLSERVSWV